MALASETPDDPTIPAAIARTLVDPEAYATSEIHDAYTWLRANNPVGRAKLDGFDPFWVLTRHADILDVSRKNALFHNADLSTTLTDKANDARAREITGGSPHLVRSLVQMDEPDHMKYRLLTQAWFMPANIRKREDDIRAMAKRSVETMAAANGRCDFVREVALHFPLRVVMSILGVPPDDEPRMLKLTQELFGPRDPDTSRAIAALSAEKYAAILQATIDDFTAYFKKISEDRRARPRDDLATLIANATIDGKPLPDFEATGYYIIVATAGHDTTSSSTAAGMWALARNPALLERLRADLSLVPAFVDEAIRWATPVKHFMRTAAEDTQIGGRRVATGDWLMLCYASGNRDETVFERPFEFDIDRTPNRHIAFGNGAHLCIGQHLAKMEMRILFEEMLPRLESVAPDGDAKSVASWFVSGLKTLPIRFELA